MQLILEQQRNFVPNIREFYEHRIFIRKENFTVIWFIGDNKGICFVLEYKTAYQKF